MSPIPWRVERGFSACRILAADDSVVADGLTLADAEAIVAALGVVDAARRREDEIYAALAAYDEAAR